MSDKPIFIGEGGGLEALFGDLLKAKPEVPPSEIEARANASVRKAVDYFKGQGIDLGYVPRVKYTGETFKINPNAIAAVDTDVDFYKSVLGLMGATLMKTVYEKQFGLKLSDQALKQGVEVAKRELEAMFPNGILGHDADIFLFRQIQNKLEDLDDLMAHEVWHLIEKKHRVLDGTGFIHEGTATYVQNRFSGRESEWRGAETDYFGTVYNNVAHLVQEEVKGKSNPLLAILNPETRKVVQRQFEEKVLPLFYEKASELIAAGATRDFGRELVSNHPAYEAFRRKPNAENLLNAFRLRGYVQIAEELGKQDLKKLVTYHREMLT